MANVFEVGKCYEAADRNYDPIRVVRRTACFVFVEDAYSGVAWRMKIRKDSLGEYAVDSSAGKHWADVFTYRPQWEFE